jgi:hypothetical protein
MLNVVIYAGQIRCRQAKTIRQEQEGIVKDLADKQKTKDEEFQRLTKTIEYVHTSDEETEPASPSGTREITLFVIHRKQHRINRIQEAIRTEFT